MVRPTRIQDIVGHRNVLTLMESRAMEREFPQFSIIYGEEGLGKSAVADLFAKMLVCTDEVKPCGVCANCKESDEFVIKKGESSNDIKVFSMGADGGKAAATNIIEYLNTNFSSSGVKVIRLVEGQCMSDAAQEALDAPFEHLPRDVYVLMCTTDITRLTRPFLQRASVFTFSKLSNKEMGTLIDKECRARRLMLEDSDIARKLIIDFSDNKPRAALKVLETMGSSRNVPLFELQTYCNFISPVEFQKILVSFTGSLAAGLLALDELTITPNTQRQFLKYIQAVLRYKARLGAGLYNYESLIMETSENTLAIFLAMISSISHFDDTSLLAAYVACHPEVSRLNKHDNMGMNDEYFAMSQVSQTMLAEDKGGRRPDVGSSVNSLADLLKQSAVVEKGDDMSGD